MFTQPRGRRWTRFVFRVTGEKGDGGGEKHGHLPTCCGILVEEGKEREWRGEGVWRNVENLWEMKGKVGRGMGWQRETGNMMEGRGRGEEVEEIGAECWNETSEMMEKR